MLFSSRATIPVLPLSRSSFKLFTACSAGEISVQAHVSYGVKSAMIIDPQTIMCSFLPLRYFPDHEIHSVFSVLLSACIERMKLTLTAEMPTQDGV